MRRTIGILFLLAGCLGLASPIHAQTPPPTNPPTATFSAQSFQTDLFTGAASSEIPIMVAPGTAGVAPKIALQYNSGVVDELEKEQGEWTGLGWSVDVGGFVLRDTKNTTTTTDDTFKLIFGGVSHDLVLVDSAQSLYRTKDEQFWLIKFNSASDYWTVKTKDGTTHRFGFTANSRATGLTFATNVEVPVTFKYLLDEVTTSSGTSVRYSYFKQSSSYNAKAYDQAVYPDTITYTYHSGVLVGPAREVRFLRAPRTDWTDTSPSTHASYHELSLLDAIEVRVGASLVRKYDFTYDYSIDRDPTKTWGGGATGDLTLKSVTMFGTDGTSALPSMTFTYNSTGRLASASNGIGGSASYTYEPIIATDPERHRVLTRGMSDGLGWSATTSFLYGSFALSSDGKEFLGHAWTHAVDPLGHYTDTYFHQDDAKKGHISQVEVRDSASALFSQVTNTYTVTNPFTGVNFVALTRVDKYECDGQLTCQQSAQTLTYDSFGNPTATVHLGDVSIATDDRNEVTDWIVDQTNWLHRPKRTALHEGTTTAGALLREKWLSYDGLAWGLLGTRGLLTKEESRLAGAQGNAGNPVVTHTYDVYGNKTSTTDPRGCTTTTTFESSQTYPQTVTRCSNGGTLAFTTNFQYDNRFGVVTSATDPNNQTTTSTYDVFGRLTKVTGPLDTASTYGTVSHQYLDWGTPNLQRIKTLRTEQSGTANVISTEQYFDGLGRFDETRTEGPGGQTIISEITLDSRGLVAAKSAPRFLTETPIWTQSSYDAMGRQIEVLHPDGTRATTSYLPDVITMTDENWNVKRKHLDVYDRLVKVEEVNDDGTYTTTYQYDAAGSLRFVTNHFGHQTIMTYDLLGRKIAMQDPNMGTWSYTYTKAGDLDTQTDAKNQKLCFTYDLIGRPLTKKQGATCATTLVTWTYDDPAVSFSKGRVTKVVDTSATTTFTYDVLGRVTQTKRTIDGVLYTMSQSYDALGRVTSETFPDADTVTYTYNEAGWLSTIPNYVTSITYNARGQREQLQYANGAVSKWSYDPNTFRVTQRQTIVGGVPGLIPLTRFTKSWTIQTSAPTGFATVYRGLIRVTDEDDVSVGGDIVSESGLGSVSGYMKTTAATGTVPVYKSFCYRDTAGTCIASTLSLDVNGTPVGYLSKTPPDSQSMFVPFSESGGILLDGIEGETPSAYLWTTFLTTQNRTDYFYGNDDFAPDDYIPEPSPGFLDASPVAGTVPLYRFVNATTSQHYYSTFNDPPAGFAQELTLGYLRTTSATGRIPLYRHYNSTTGAYLLITSSTPPSGYVLQSLLGYIWTLGSAGTSLQDLFYSYDNVGNITSITDPIFTGSREFSYDALNRLTSGTGNFGASQALATHAYKYDAIGNILEKAGIVYSYTNSLHPSAVTSTSDGKNYTYDNNGNMVTGGNRTFVWDVDNRVTSVTTGGVTATMAYDYTGMRVKKNGSGGTTYFPFSGYEAGPGSLITKYIRIGIENIASKKSTGEKLFYHNDHLGGVNITTNASGLLAQIIEYDPWGKVSRSEGAGDSLRRFTGKILDPESGLYYYGARYYDPELGRFISPDPIVPYPDDPQSHNRYSYIVNNPVNGIDPDGNFHIVKKKKCRSFFCSVFGRIFFAAVFAVVSYGAFTWLSGGTFSLTGAAVTGAAAASAAGVMEIPAIKRFLARAGPAAGFFFSLGLNMGFQLAYGALASPTLVEAREFNYAQASPEQQATADLILKEGRGINIVSGDPSNPGLGSIPRFPGEIDRGLFSGERLIGLTSKSLGGEHIGIRLLPELLPKDVVARVGVSSLYGISGISHQAVSMTFLQAGLRGSILTVAQGYTPVLSSLAYGPYGGGAALNPGLNPWLRDDD